MDNKQTNAIYVSHDEKELIKMWEDIKGTNLEKVNRNLMKSIAKNEEENLDTVWLWKMNQKEPDYTKRMWDSEKCEWVPFDLWGAYFIVNERKEHIVLQIWRPVDIQPEFGPILKAWCSLDSSYLNDQLRENKDDYEKFNQLKSFAGVQGFKEMVRQDQQELKYEGRYDELNGHRSYRRI